MPKTEKKSVVWIDCAKFLAILAVLIDHGKGILYEGETIQYISFFSVSVFFFLSGMTTWYSLGRKKAEETFVRWTARRLWRIIAPYLVAVAVCQFFKSGFTLSLGPYILWALNFNLEGQFYFVLIYLQLIAAAPVLYLLTVFCRRGRFSFLWRSGYLAAALALSLFCVKHSTALQTYGGGNYLLGGTYLFLFVMGMIAADMQIVIRYRSRAFFCAAVATVIYAAALVFLLKDRLALDEALFGWLLRVNPPGITMTVYSLAVIFLIFLVQSGRSDESWSCQPDSGCVRLAGTLHPLYFPVPHADPGVSSGNASVSFGNISPQNDCVSGGDDRSSGWRKAPV